jgi:hypothetical protein
MSLTPPNRWTEPLIDVSPQEYVQVPFYGVVGLEFVDRHHTCNDNARIETVRVSVADARFAFWAANVSGQPQLYVRRGASPDWAWASVIAGTGNEWTDSHDPQGGPTHWWRLLVQMWHYQYSDGNWQYIGPKTLNPIQLFGGVPYLQNEFSNNDSASEVCGPSGADRAWVPWQVQLQMCGKFGGPVPTLWPEWSYVIARAALDECLAYRAVSS